MLISRAVLLFASTLLATQPVTAQRASSPVTRFIEVEPGVNLEVIDWGGSGRPFVLLAGYGRTAHDFDTFGPALSPTYHAYSVTRRGFGASSKPASGYAADRLGDDVLAVIDSLHLVRPIVGAHSLGGEELSSIGSRYPERVSGLVYLDAAYGYAFYDEQDEMDSEFINRNEVVRGLREFTDALNSGRAEDAHRLIARMRTIDLPALDRSLRAADDRIPQRTATPRRPLTMQLRPGVDQMVFEGLQRYTQVKAPVLAIYALKGMSDSTALADWYAGRRHELIALKRGAPQARVLILPNAPHDIFRSNVDDILKALRAFEAPLPK